MRNSFRQKNRENQNTHFVFRNFFSENRAVYERMWKNIVEPGRPQMTWRMRIACLIPKSTSTHSQYVILIAFPQQQRLYERASMLRYVYIACLACLREGIQQAKRYQPHTLRY